MEPFTLHQHRPAGLGSPWFTHPQQLSNRKMKFRMAAMPQRPQAATAQSTNNAGWSAPMARPSGSRAIQTVQMKHINRLGSSSRGARSPICTQGAVSQAAASFADPADVIPDADDDSDDEEGPRV